jgi:hypothetical protein
MATSPINPFGTGFTTTPRGQPTMRMDPFMPGFPRADRFSAGPSQLEWFYKLSRPQLPRHSPVNMPRLVPPKLPPRG